MFRDLDRSYIRSRGLGSSSKYVYGVQENIVRELERFPRSKGVLIPLALGGPYLWRKGMVTDFGILTG